MLFACSPKAGQSERPGHKEHTPQGRSLTHTYVNKISLSLHLVILMQCALLLQKFFVLDFLFH